MRYDREIHHRRSIRLKDYDYSQPGAYFVTICVKGRKLLFGEIIDGQMVINRYGEIVKYTWYDLPNHNDNILLDEFVIMPNHVHGIIIINNVGAGSVGAGSEPAPTTPTTNNSLTEIVRQFKTFSAYRINKIRQMTGVPVWQRNYYEHIIRNENELNKIRKYIVNNPLKWHLDRENPDRIAKDDLENEIFEFKSKTAHSFSKVVGAGSEPAPTITNT